MKKLMNNMKKGFTIVELVIVIAVIGILAAVLIPTFSNVISSANEAADLQEAQNSLKAYTAYVTSQGSELSDGAVFKVNNSHYVFYKGSLHKFEVNKEGTEATPKGANNFAVLDKGPKVSIGNVDYACDSKFQLKEGNAAVQLDGKDVNFYYFSKVPVQFDDGSKKAEIYAGSIYTEAITATNTYKNIELDLSGLSAAISGTLKVKYGANEADVATYEVGKDTKYICMLASRTPVESGHTLAGYTVVYDPTTKKIKINAAAAG